MEVSDALNGLAALAQETRLTAFRLLVTSGPEGLTAGEVAERLGVLPNTLSTHLGILSRADLATSAREGRTIRYAANYAAIQELLAFLMRDCCAGRPEICAPLLQIAESCAACLPDNASMTASNR